MNTDVRSLAISGTNIFAGTWGGGVWRRPLSEMITSVARPSTDLPTHFILNQNYPNPFNPNTRISYSLAVPAQVQLTVCNMFGQQVALLDEGLEPAGNFSVDFNGDGLPSGIYYYRLQCGNRQETRQMILIK